MFDRQLELASEITAAVLSLHDRVNVLEQRDAMRTTSRAALRDAGYSSPTDTEVDRIISEFVEKRYTARRVSTAPAPLIDWTQPVTVLLDGCTIATWDPTEQRRAAVGAVNRKVIDVEALPKADLGPLPEGAVTRDAGARLEAHSRHLRNLDARLKTIERGAP
jgi:hypothetical protein